MATSNMHDVRYDFAGVNANHPRLTCYTKACKQATLVAQPYMTQTVFDEKVGAFLKQHPPIDGLIVDAEYRRSPLKASEMI